ncbi:MAG TPA: HEAT repeat domain-containing protein, partial [Ktedonobacteraceae bacterium]|nr:HEAT repeat domain-containing protein [Ktedonobacteraceae bacterium]
NAHSHYGMAEGITRIFTLLRSDEPTEHIFGLLCDGIQSKESVHILDSLYERLTPELIRAGAAHRYGDETTAIDVLGAMQEEVPVELLMSILKDESKNKFVRVHALYTLHDLGIAVPLEYFVLGQDWCIYSVDNDMIESMTRLGQQAPIPALVELLGYDNNWVRASARRSLQNLAEHVPVELLCTALESKNASMREEAAGTLSAFGERAPVDKLLAMLSDEREKLYVRNAILGTLTNLGIRVPVDLLLRLMQLDDYNLRQATFDAFAVMGKDAPLDVLLTLLDDKTLRSNVLKVFGSLEENAPVDLLLSIFDNKAQSWSDSRSALHALAKLGKHAPVEEMIARLYDEDGEICGDLIDAFGEMGEYAPIDIILKAFNSNDHEVRSEADTALSVLSEDAPARLVAEARDDPRPVIRKRVLQALVKMGKDAPIEIALASLEDKETRADALSVLLELKVDVTARISKDTLVRMLDMENTDEEVNWQKLELLEQFGEPIPVELLLSALGGGSSVVAEKLYKRYPAVFRAVVAPQAEAILRGEPVGGVFASLVQTRIARAIGQIGRATPEVLNLVVDLLDWPYRETRLEAVRALGAIHRAIPDRAIRRLLELRRDPQSSELRRAADVALAEILSYENGMEDEA